MSGPMSEMEKRKRQVPCPSCGAAIGKPCKAASGRENSYAHVARHYLTWDRGGFLPARQDQP